MSRLVNMPCAWSPLPRCVSLTFQKENGAWSAFRVMMLRRGAELRGEKLASVWEGASSVPSVRPPVVKLNP